MGLPRPRRLRAPGASDCVQSIEQREHASDVLRLRKVTFFAMLIWCVGGLPLSYFDLAQEPGTFRRVATTQLVALLFVVPAWLRLRARPLVSRRTFRLLDVLMFTVTTSTVAVQCVFSHGLMSTHHADIVVVVLTRGLALSERWRRGALQLALPALAYPVVLLVAAPWSPLLQAQFHDPIIVSNFAGNAVFIAIACLLIVIGGHSSWALRRQLFEMRSVGGYRLRTRLGVGAMGEVWRAEHPTLRRDVALKILRPDAASPEAHARFEREVQALSELKHPNTVRILDFGETEDGLSYYVMELLEGQTVRQLVASQGALPAARVAAIGNQAARALAEAHARGIVHRDVKPENLFVAPVDGEQEVVKVLDFGIARLFESETSSTLTHTGWVLGTPAFMSPEQAAGRPVGAAADIYSLGCVLYFLLTGRHPFERTNAVELLHAHLSDTPDPPSRHAAVPPELDRLVLRCLQKSPEARFPTATSLADALASLSVDVAPAGAVRATAGGPSTPASTLEAPIVRGG